MFNKKRPTVEYWTEVSGLTAVEEACPAPYRSLAPDWWSKAPFGEHGERTAKNCPALSDMFSSAYVLRMWCDVVLTFRGNEFKWKTPNPNFVIESHPNFQFLDYLPSDVRSKVRAVLKPVSPWLLKTPKGFSTYQMPMTYEFDDRFTVLPGIIHTDVYHSTNPQLLITSQEDEIFIKRGTPLALHFPFKREKLGLEINERNASEVDFLRGKTDMISTTKFVNSYRMITRKFL